MGNRGWYLIKTIIGYSLDHVYMPLCLCEPQNRVLISLSLILVFRDTIIMGNEVCFGLTLHVEGVCVCQYVQVIGSSLCRTLQFSIAAEWINEVSAGGGIFFRTCFSFGLQAKTCT